MAGRHWLLALVVAAVAVGFGYTALKVYHGSQPETCHACQRPIHAHSRTVALVNGQTGCFAALHARFPNMCRRVDRFKSQN